LGASNLTLSLRIIIQLLQQIVGGPSDILVAAGHGRSYGQNSQVLMRELPGIVQCGLWQQLQSDRTLPVYALLTDIGNDIPYGCMPEQIIEWVLWCVQQLQQQDARIMVTNLPITSIQALPEIRFNMLRSLLFPSCKLSCNEVVERACAVHRHLNDLAVQHQVVLQEPDTGLMGVDGIHVSLWKRRDFYQSLFDNLANIWKLDTSDVNSPVLSWRQHPQFAMRRICGRTFCTTQPSGYLSDRSIVSLY